ncbi:MAG: hypothetical protein HKP51_04865 [Sulfitobacter sp.]|nr:hypothetical protein [Sulfitobacter sp.]
MFRRLFSDGIDSPQALRLLLVMGGLSLVFLAAPGIHVFLLVSVIGIPLIPAAILFPPLVLIWCCVLSFRLILPIEGRLGTVLACVATALLLFLPAQWMNNSAFVRTVELTADDHNSAVLPLRSDKMAIINRGKGHDDACGRLCLHALLSGSASTVIVAKAPIDTALPDPKMITTAYYFEQRHTCPDVELDPQRYVLPQEGIPALNGYVIKPQRNAAEIATQRIASGTCLMSRKARISEADLMVILGPVVKEKSRNTGFQFRLKGIEASRLNVYQGSGAGDFNEVFRATSGTSMQFFPVLLPMASWVLNEPSGWLRTSFRFGDEDYSSERKRDVFDTLEGEMGIDLALDDRNYRKSAQDSIIAVLDAGRAPTQAEWQAFSVYWKSLSFLGTRMTDLGPDARDAGIATRIVQSPHMPLPQRFGDFVRYATMAKRASADVLAEGLAGRLRTESGRSVISEAGYAMFRLPDDVLRDHLDLLEELAQEPDKRLYVSTLLHKLYLGGLESAPILLDLVEAGVRLGDRALAIQGLRGLCRIGPDARLVLERLDETLISMTSREDERYFEERIAVSAHLGIDRETVRRKVPEQIIAANKPDWFDRHYRRGSSQRSACN